MCGKYDAAHGSCGSAGPLSDCIAKGSIETAEDRTAQSAGMAARDL